MSQTTIGLVNEVLVCLEFPQFRRQVSHNIQKVNESIQNHPTHRASLSDVGMTLHLLVSIALICQSESQQTPMFFVVMYLLVVLFVVVAVANETSLRLDFLEFICFA